MWSSPSLEPGTIIIFNIDDLITASKVIKLFLFANDTKAFFSHSSLSELKDTIGNDLKNLIEWFRTNKLTLYSNKSCYITFTFVAPNKNRDDIKTTVTSRRDQYLAWGEHI